MIRYILIFIFSILFSSYSFSKDDRLIIASTTSTYDSGLLNYLNSYFQKIYNIDIHVIALGTGQAIKIAENGDADILLVHHKPSELKFINENYGIKRFDLMYNDYIIIGPKDDADRCNSIESFFHKILKNKLIFVSRGDESGTHKKEKELWNLIKFNNFNKNDWYINIGQGMGAALMITNEKKAYTLADRATWINFKNKENLKIICENKNSLINQYGIIAVNPKINDRVNYIWAEKYINWILSDQGKELINNYKVNNQQLFFFNN